MSLFPAAALAVGLLVAQSGNPQSGLGPKFNSLSPQDSARLDKQRLLVAAAVKQHYGGILTRSQKDLPLLQKLIDDSVFNKTQTYELQSIGIVFGDVLVSALPLHWVMITDESGTDPTLRYKNTSANINAMTMISKRVEQGRRVNLQELLVNTREGLVEFEKNSR